MQALTKYISINVQRSSPVPYMVLRGSVNHQMTNRVQRLLKRVPSNASKIAVVVNAYDGQFSQAEIIINKLHNKARENNLELITFGHRYALNSGFYLLMSGHKVYADRTTLMGGIQNGQAKVVNPKLAQFIKNISYLHSPSYPTESTKNESYNPEKAEQMKNIYQGFSQEARSKIVQFRKGKLSKEVNLQQFYTGQEGEKGGLVDGIGRLHTVMPKMVENDKIYMLRESWISKLKRWRR